MLYMATGRRPWRCMCMDVNSSRTTGSRAAQMKKTYRTMVRQLNTTMLRRLQASKRLRVQNFAFLCQSAKISNISTHKKLSPQGTCTCISPPLLLYVQYITTTTTVCTCIYMYMWYIHVHVVYTCTCGIYMYSTAVTYVHM